MKRHYLGEFEELVLLVVATVDGDAYGFSVNQEITTQTKRSVRLNQVHASLQRLEDKGMVRSKMSEPTAERGGRRRRVFTITAYGRQTLREIKSTRNQLWELIPGKI